jgi:hypothetical protein
LIWHCNGDATIDNDYEGFRMIDLEEADGLDQLDDKSSIMDDGDPFPGSTNNTSFNDATTPASTDIFGDPTGVSAEGFTYVSGPGSDVMVTLTQRTLEGFTLSYHAFASTSFFGTSNAVVKYGATRFTTTEEGLLVGIQTGVKQDNSYDYNVRVFDDMIGGSPSGLHSTTSGTFPSVPTKRWIDMALSDSLMLAADQTFLVDVGFGPTPYPVPYVHQYPLSGQSYKSNDGTIYESWTDKDVMIRARIKYMCCGRFTSGYTGNTDCDTEGKMSLADVTKLIDRVYLSKTPLCCEENGNVDGDPEGKMALADITKLIDHIYLSKAETAACE